MPKTDFNTSFNVIEGVEDLGPVIFFNRVSEHGENGPDAAKIAVENFTKAAEINTKELYPGADGIHGVTAHHQSHGVEFTFTGTAYTKP